MIGFVEVFRFFPQYVLRTGMTGRMYELATYTPSLFTFLPSLPQSVPGSDTW